MYFILWETDKPNPRHSRNAKNHLIVAENAIAFEVAYYLRMLMLAQPALLRLVEYSTASRCRHLFSTALVVNNMPLNWHLTFPDRRHARI